MQSSEGLWITVRNPKKPWIWKKLRAPNIHQAFEVQFNYLLYTFSNQIADTYTTVEQNRCKLQNRLRYDTFEHLEGDRFVKD